MLAQPEIVTPAPVSVLIVEDEKIVAKDLEKSLRRLGYEIVGTAASAEEAVRCATACCPDVVLMDIRIKGELDGIETARLLRQRFDVAVIYLTAYADDETVGRARTTEPFGYVLKPFKARELHSAIEIALFKHRMERRLREREHWFSTTLRAIGDAVIAVDCGGHVTFMNLAAELLTGMRSEQTAGKRLVDVLRFEDERTGAPIENPIKKAFSEGRVVGLPPSAMLVSPAGERPVDDSAAPIIDETGQLLGAVLVFRDVTEQRRLQQQIALADRLASLGTLAASVAHEVNNPLAVVVGNAAFVEQHLKKLEVAIQRLGAAHQVDVEGLQSTAATMTDALADLKEGAERASRIVADLRAFGRPHDDPKAATDVVAAAGWAVRVTTSQIRPCARLVQDLRAVPLVRGSATRIGQVLVNLLVNAAQAIGEGHPESNEIAVSTGLGSDGQVVVEVRDTGCGMAPEVLAHVFDPFFTTKSLKAGSGLGLSICHGIVKALGGEITAESVPGQGSRFRLVLPCAETEDRAKPSPPKTTSSTRRARILIVDDEAVILRALQRTLDPDHDLIATGSVAEALHALAENPNVDLIFCDLMLPELTGMDLYERLVAEYPELASRVVFLTAGAFTTRAVDFLASTHNPHIEKPFDPATLRAFVQSLLGERIGPGGSLPPKKESPPRQRHSP